MCNYAHIDTTRVVNESLPMSNTFSPNGLFIDENAVYFRIYNPTPYCPIPYMCMLLALLYNIHCTSTYSTQQQIRQQKDLTPTTTPLFSRKKKTRKSKKGKRVNVAADMALPSLFSQSSFLLFLSFLPFSLSFSFLTYFFCSPYVYCTCITPSPFLLLCGSSLQPNTCIVHKKRWTWVPVENKHRMMMALLSFCQYYQLYILACVVSSVCVCCFGVYIYTQK